MKKLENEEIEEIEEIEIKDLRRKYRPNIILMILIIIIFILGNIWSLFHGFFGTITWNIFNMVMVILAFIQERILAKPFKDSKVGIKDLEVSLNGQKNDQKEKYECETIVRSIFLISTLSLFIVNIVKITGVLESSYGVYVKIFNIICFIIISILFIILKRHYKKYWR